jgi:hypothetical protein
VDDVTVIDDDIAAAVNSLLTALNEVTELRYGTENDPVPGMPPATASPSEVIEVLRNVRQRMDRIEELFALAIRIRGTCKTQIEGLQFEVDREWDASAVRRMADRPEYSSTRERYAEVNLDNIESLNRINRMRVQMGKVDTVHAVIQLAYRGLDGFRNDLNAVLRALQFESHLER